MLNTPRSPVSGATASMGHGDDLDGCWRDPINHRVRKTAEEKFSCAVQVHGPAFWVFGNLTDCVIELGYESICRDGIALGVPLISSSCLNYSFRMEFNAWTSHGIVRGFGVWRRTREPFSLFPYPNRQCVARSLYSTLLPRPHPPSHLNFRSDDRRVQRALQQADAAPLPKPFCGSCSWNKLYNGHARQHKFKAREVI
jgi:hypothetical protein